MTVTETMLLSLTHYLLLLFISSGPSIMCCGLTQKLTLQIWLQLRCLGMCGKLLCSMYINLCTRTVFHFPALRSRCVALHYVPVPLRSIAFPLRSFAFHSVAFLFATVALPLRCVPVMLRSRCVTFPFCSFPFFCVPLLSRCVAFRYFPLRSIQLRFVAFRCAPVALRCVPVMLMSLCVAIPLCCVPVPFPLRSVAVHSVHSLRRVPIALRSRSVAFHSFAFRCAPVALRSFLLHSRSVLLRCAARPCVRTCVPLKSIAFQLRSVAIHCVPVAFR